jgi:hypothetical protein
LPLTRVLVGLLLFSSFGHAAEFGDAQPISQSAETNAEALDQAEVQKASHIPVIWNASYNHFANDSGLVVSTPAFGLEVQLDERSSLALRYTVDAVSAASFNYDQSKTHARDPTRKPGSCWQCHPQIDAMSGASQNYIETRHELEFSVKRRIAETTVSAGYAYSKEHDYLSQTFKVGLDQDLFGRNTTLSLSFSHLDDVIQPIWENVYHDSLTTNGVDLFLTQVLTPSSEVRLGASWADAEGFQSDPYEFVEIGGDTTHPTPVVQPGSKSRLDLTLRYKQGLPWESAAELGYRYYQDSWQVQGHTADLLLSKKIDRFVLEPEYRHYTQNAASFFQNFYAQPETYMTRDLKLAAFSTQYLGLGLRGDLTDSLSGSLRFARYWRTDGLDYSLYYADGPMNAYLFQVGMTYQ